MMRSAVRRFLFLFVIALAGSVNAQRTDEKKDLPNFVPINANLYRGGQPTEAGVRKLAGMGIKAIVNLRGADENSLKEKAWARNTGIKFIAFDLSNWFKPKTAEIKRVIKEINAPENQPVFVHCKRGADRTGTVIAVYRIAHDGWNAQQATSEAKKFGFGWWQLWMKDYIDEYYRDFKKSN